ncbi:glycosyltransferase family 4 protein [Thermodesulfobacteriota bacterium]
MPEKPIRILRIIARLNIGGPAIQAITLSSDMRGKQYDTLLVSGKISSREGDMSYLADEKGVRPYIVSEMGREISILDDLGSFRKLRRVIKSYRPHIIHTHTAKAGTIGRLAGLSVNFLKSPQKRIKIVHTFHGHIFHSYFSYWKTRFFILIERFLAKYTDKIVVISPIQKEDICRRFSIAGREKVKIIPLGFDLSRFSTQGINRDKLKKKYFPDGSGDALIVGIVGRLTPVKNHRMFLDAVKHLKDQGKSQLFKFLIVGDGELKEELAEHANRLGVQKSVIFTGWQKDMPLLYGVMDILVLTSLNEGTPVTLIEAMASAKPVVATDVGGVRDLLGEVDGKRTDIYEPAQNGVIIPSQKADVLAQALLYLHENRDFSKRLGKQARNFVLDRYSKDRLLNDMDALYRGLVSFHP